MPMPRQANIARHMHHQASLPASYYRGGTSRALFFHRHHLPTQQVDWPLIFRGALGSPDSHGRQLDGMGGGISSLSKICVVSPSERADADVDFTFAAVGVTTDEVDLAAACGNMTAAVGPWAVNEGVFKVDAGRAGLGDDFAEELPVIVRIFNTNTSKLIHARFPVTLVEHGKFEASTTGSFTIDGVSGTAPKIQLDFIDPGGSKTGKMLPTGYVVDVIHGKQASCVDVGNPAVFVRASDFNVDGRITPAQMQETPGLLEQLDAIRREAAVRMGMSPSVHEVPGGIPKISLVGPARGNADHDLTVRAVSVGQPHRAIPITTALAVATAAQCRGSIVQQCASEGKVSPDGLTIGHASGKLVVGATMDGDGNVTAATVFRTARRLMEGHVFWR